MFRRNSTPALAWVLLGWLVASVAGASRGTWLHPQDGPHADLRFDLRADAFVADISMNLTFLDYLLEPQREQADRLEPSELRQLKPRLLQRMAEVCRITADGRPLEPTLEELGMNDPDESLLPLFPRSGMRGLRKIRFQLVFPIEGEPNSLSIVWSCFPPDELSTLDPKPPLTLAAELTAQGVRSQLEFSEREPEYTWHAMKGGIDARLLAVPLPAPPSKWRVSFVTILGTAATVVIGVVAVRRRRARWIAAVFALGTVASAWLPSGGLAAGLPFGSSGLPSDEEAAAIFRPLHANLYRAFDFTEEQAIYDALAKGVDGPLLEDLYLTIHRSLVMQEEGGAMSRVRAVRESSLAIDAIGMVPASTGHRSMLPPEGDGPVPGFVVRCRYQVDGRVTHWGHSHDRTNEYLVRCTVVARSAGWRIAEVEVLEQSRVDEPSPAPEEPRPVDDGSFEV